MVLLPLNGFQFDPDRVAMAALIDALLGAAADAVFTLDRQFRYTGFNRRHAQLMKDIHGADIELGRSLLDYVRDSGDEAALRASLQRALDGESLSLTTAWPIPPRADERHFEMQFHPVRQPDGEAVGVAVTVRDITGQLQRETAWRETEWHFRSTIEAAPLAVFILKDGRIRYANPSALKVLGVGQLPDIVGRPVTDFVAPASRPLLMSRLERLAQQQANEPASLEVVTADGRRLLMESTSAPLILDGQPAALVMSLDITQREATRAALERSNALLRSIFQTLPAGVGMSIDRVLVQVNDYLCQMLGYRSEELLNQSARMLYATQAEYERVGRVKYEQIRQSGIGTIETQWLHRDGHTLDIYLSSSPIDPADWAKGITFTAIDITARKRAEAALLESEERFRTLYENATVGLYRTTPGGRILIANPATVRMLGYTSMEELQRRPLADGFEPQYPREVFLERIERDGAIHGLESIWKRHDGVLIYVRESARAVRDEQGRTLYYDGTVEDITERKQAEAAEREQRALAEALRDSAAALTGTLNLEEVLDRILENVGRVVSNDATAIYMITGSTVRAVRWQAPAHFKPADLLSLVFPLVTTRNLREMMTSGEPVFIPDTRADPDWVILPSIDWIRSYVGAPIIVHGEVIGFLEADAAQPGFYGPAHARSLMAFASQAAAAIHNARLHAQLQHHAEELEERVFERTRELEEANVKLRELDRLKDEFISRISHELRTPLTSIKIYLDLLTHGRPDKRQHYLDVLNEQSDRLQMLIEQLLKVSALDLDRLTVELKPVDVNQLARDLITHFTSRALEAKVTLKLTVEPGLPRVMADATALAQAVGNLLQNALAYTPAGGTVTVTTQRQTPAAQDWVTLMVADTGPGISDRDLPHIFERFYRGEAAHDYRTPGVGLGLTLSRDLIHRLGGQITVESTPGAGAVFMVWLPVSPMEPAA